MKTTKFLFLALLMVLAVGGLHAQDAPDRDPAARAEQQAERLSSVLELTPEQTEQVKRINADFAEQVEAARTAHREAMQQAQDERKTAIEKILTAEQRTKLEALEAARKERRTARDNDDRRPRRRNRG